MQNIHKLLNRGCLALMALTFSSITAIETQGQYQLSQFTWGSPSGINNSGTIVVYGALDPETFEEVPALLNGDSLTIISIPNAFFTVTGGINSQGTIVGSAYTEDGPVGFIRTKQGEVISLTVPGALATMPSGINSRGVVVGAVQGEEGLNRGFIWDSTGPKLFDAPGADSTELVGINASGTAVGTYTSGGKTRVFALTGARFSPLNIPDASSSYAGGINGSGQIVGSYSSQAQTNLQRGFIYDRGAVTPVDYFLSEDLAPASFPPRPFDRGARGRGTVTYVRTLQFTAVTGMNDRGDIVGRAGSLYTPMVECGGCGLTPNDFFFVAYLDTFTGERDGSRTVHPKNAAGPRRIRVAHGTSARELILGRKP